MDEQQEKDQQQQQRQPPAQNTDAQSDDSPDAQSREEMLNRSKNLEDRRPEDEITGEGTGSRGGEYS